mmetsp:Transcript_20543/g.57048  ORF Transcript_20543/g.57048 Transcript_20543/m.57048 type:complete len:252 (+) Transcript_20543:134-889(+)
MGGIMGTKKDKEAAKQKKNKEKEIMDQCIEEERSNALDAPFCNCDHDGASSPQLSQDLLSLTCWSGDFCRDYRFHVRNSHPLLGAFLCHPAHPYSKIERAAVLCFTSGLTIAGSAVITFRANESDTKIVDELSPVLILFLVTVPVSIVQTVIEQVAVLDSRFQGCGLEPLAWCAFLAGFACTACVLFATGVVLLISFVWLLPGGRALEVLIYPVVVSRLQSWLLWFLPDMFMPCFGFYSCWHSENRSRQKD